MITLKTGSISANKGHYDKTSPLDQFIDNINAINQDGPGYIFIHKYTYHDSDVSGTIIDDESSIVVKLKSAFPPKKGFLKNTPGSVIVQLTNGAVVPLFDQEMMEKGIYNGNGYVPHAVLSDEINSELNQYSWSPLEPDKNHTKSVGMRARFYAENNYQDMAALNDLVQKENKRRENIIASKREAAARAAAYAAEKKAKDDALRDSAAQLASQFNKMFGK